MTHAFSSGVVRGPDGKFMSASDLDRADAHREALVAQQKLGVPAADLTTGNDFFRVDGEESIVIDLEEVLDTDEAFAIHYVELVTSMEPNRTATAEHNITNAYVLATDLVDMGDAPLGDNAVDISDGVVDIRVDDRENDDVLLAGQVTGSGDIGDSTNGLGAGADHQVFASRVNFPAAGLPTPVVDDDDEIVIANGLAIRGSDDQGANVAHTAVLHGVEFDIS